MHFDKEILENMVGLFGDLQGKPENEIINELAEMIKSGQGGITPNKAIRMIHSILPMADSNQRIKLEKLLKLL